MSMPLRRWPAAGGLLLLFAAATYSRADADLWGHLQYGLDAIEDRGLTEVDPYSFTQDRPWVNHEWLSEVLTAASWLTGGTAGLVTLKGAVISATFLLMWSALRGATVGVRLALMAFAAFATVHATSSVRPQIWTFLFIAVLCRALSGRSWPERYWLIPLFALWANLHGGWVVGLGVLGVWAALESLTERDRLRTWIWLVPACATATLLTPYGIGLWTFVLITVRPERDIQEWLPVFTMDVGVWAPWVVTVVLAPFAFRHLDVSRLPVAGVLLMLAWLAFRVMRINSLFVESAIILLAPAVVSRFRAAAPSNRAQAPMEWMGAAYLFLIAAGAASWIGASTLTCVPVRGPMSPEPEPVLMLASAPDGRMVTFFDWGQYALWHVGPRIRVSMDGRRETVYTDARIAQHDAIVNGDETGFTTLIEWNPEYVWLPSWSDATKSWLVDRGYRIEFESDRSFLAVRADLPDLPDAPPAGSTGCFPG